MIRVSDECERQFSRTVHFARDKKGALHNARRVLPTARKTSRFASKGRRGNIKRHRNGQNAIDHAANGDPTTQVGFLGTTREFKNLTFSDAGYWAMALASENSELSLANSHLPRLLASGDLIMRSHLPSDCKNSLQSLREHLQHQLLDCISE